MLFYIRKSPNKDEVFLFPYDVQCLYEKPFDGFLVQMRRGAFLPAVKFVVAGIFTFSGCFNMNA